MYRSLSRGSGKPLCPDFWRRSLHRPLWVQGMITGGCALPFFLSNLIANIYGYFQNQKTAFQASDPPAWCMWYYFDVIAALILFSTWLQGVLASRALNSGIGILSGLAPMLAAFAAGNVQIPVLFPLEKFVLFKEQRK